MTKSNGQKNGRSLISISLAVIIVLIALSIQVYLFIGHFVGSTTTDGWGRPLMQIPNWLGWIFAITGTAPIWAGWNWIIIDFFLGVLSLCLFGLAWLIHSD